MPTESTIIIVFRAKKAPGP